jgi:hypothetical protein
MAEEKKEPWLNYLALTTVILAVCATLSIFKGCGFSTRSVLNQSHAANQWACGSTGFNLSPLSPLVANAMHPPTRFHTTA